ncbi:hypothetical protein H112_07259 [Trichophyton rubrum D6]|uniref:Uncharacterized protein n=4 Tax=Trichophyton TaxID=5550 RepID=A0A178EZV7_TRIRU|nr:uncharacterized protein TERG_02582 [Trichophyton rubrum CBS 118892]EZF11733.1 hypothetical protein H100_07285 [Trichophyton rubrum MR850]EZF38618.1 hypothetical protein H102_07245 [Trichophyton rubrum CBS 100081]EZF49145.1 hypothetical protein H103_07268 [Trichophyton rubrum CBS 288.86]EZF59790.1 hypothetical protein H104_07221 [Trichophyton rubrum CBS 289.86]EZF70472.1 hypothetical protein H105_07283 [Trichophyton soudanense CBS 452.61]EZF81077.1 hypothetical protein H110_07266 [Trichophy
MTVNSVDGGTHESSTFDTNGGVKTHQEEMDSQQDNSWSAIQDREYQAASSNTASSPNAAKKKKGRASYWKEKKAAKKLAQAAVDSELNDNGGVSTSVPADKDTIQLDIENVDPNATVEQDAPMPGSDAPTKPKAKSKDRKKTKSAPSTTPLQDIWPSPPTQDDGFVDDGWGNGTQTGWYHRGESPPREETKPKKIKPKKKAVKAKVADEPAAQIGNSEPLSSKAGNVGASVNGEDPVEDGTTSVGQPTMPKKTAKKKKVKADKHAAQEQEAPSMLDGAQVDGTTGKETQPAASTAAGSNGSTNGPAPAEPIGILHTLKQVFNGVNSNTDTPTPDASNIKDSKSRQVKIQVDLDVELASILKAKVKGEMMISFMN